MLDYTHLKWLKKLGYLITCKKTRLHRSTHSWDEANSIPTKLWACTGMPGNIHLKCLSKLVAFPLVLSYSSKKSIWMNLIFVKTLKTLHLGHFWTFLDLPKLTWPFFFFFPLQKSGFVTFLTLWLNFLQKIRKKNWWPSSEIPYVKEIFKRNKEARLTNIWRKR